jgi:hypothetical protein
MPERARHADTVRAGTPLRVGSVVLLPIERDVVHAGAGARGAWFTAGKEPYALVVRDGGGDVRVLDVGATPVSLEELRERIPGLDEALGRALDMTARDPRPGDPP